MEERPKSAPETPYINAMRAADVSTINDLLFRHKPTDKSRVTNDTISPGHYWGIALAAACADAGLPIGFEKSTSTHADTDIQLYGSRLTIDYWLHLAGFELRTELDATVDATANDSRSGIFTILNNPVQRALFEHMYAAHHDLPIKEVAARDPMFEHQQLNTTYEFIDHEGFKRLYNENPDHCIRLYLTRRLPRLENLRRNIEFAERYIPFQEESLTTKPGAIVDQGLVTSAQAREEHIQFQRDRLQTWKMDYDFTVKFLVKGYQPYSLVDIIEIARGYLASLIAAHPELNPADIKTNIPDARQVISNLLTEMHRRNQADQN